MSGRNNKLDKGKVHAPLVEATLKGLNWTLKRNTNEETLSRIMDLALTSNIVFCVCTAEFNGHEKMNII